jgi:hypothetical protein
MNSGSLAEFGFMSETGNWQIKKKAAKSAA